MTGNKKFILYVDDDEDDRELLADAVKKANPELEVALAENGMEALTYLEAMKEAGDNLPCLIVLDINMPFLDGKETFTHLRKDNVLNSVPVVVFSSSERPADKQQFNEVGIQYFTKPSSISYMTAIVNQMINTCSR